MAEVRHSERYSYRRIPRSATVTTPTLAWPTSVRVLEEQDKRGPAPQRGVLRARSGSP